MTDARPMLIDSHVNLHGERFADDLDDVLARAEAAGVGAMLAICDRLSSVPAIERIVRGRMNMWRTVGVHPHHAKDHADLTADDLVRLAEPADVVGIGECGLDYHYEYSDRDVQIPVFRAHIDAARRTGLPLIVHTREADEDMGAILTEEHARGAFPILLHCYTSSRALMEAGLALGAYVSMSGIVTFKNAHDVRVLAADVPADRLLVETDCPYLTPVPHRGRRCEPAHVAQVAEKLAELRGVSVETIARTTTGNFFALFGRAGRPAAS